MTQHQRPGFAFFAPILCALVACIMPWRPAFAQQGQTETGSPQNRLCISKPLLCGTAFVIAASNAADADFQRGQQLHAEKCAGCHAEKSGLGNGDILYTRSDRKVGDVSRLKSMVARCNSELRLDLFPEDEADVVLYLQRSLYKFR